MVSLFGLPSTTINSSGKDELIENKNEIAELITFSSLKTGMIIEILGF